MTTVTAVKRALEEAASNPEVGSRASALLTSLGNYPKAVTILANRLSDRGAAGNAAVRSNLIVLEALAAQPGLSPVAKGVLEWAIDQLTPPCLNADSYIEGKDCPTLLGEVCRQGQRCCQRRPGR